MAQPAEMGYALTPEEELALQQQQQKASAMQGLMTPAQYADALFDPHGANAVQQQAHAAPADTSMYSAPVEAQYQPGGESYLAPYQAPAPNPASESYAIAQTEAYGPTPLPAPSGNPYGYAATPVGGNDSGFAPYSTTDPTQVSPPWQGFRNPVAGARPNSGYADATGQPFPSTPELVSGIGSGPRWAPEGTPSGNPYATDRNALKGELAELYRSTEQQPGLPPPGGTGAPFFMGGAGDGVLPGSAQQPSLPGTEFFPGIANLNPTLMRPTTGEYTPYQSPGADPFASYGGARSDIMTLSAPQSGGMGSPTMDWAEPIGQEVAGRIGNIIPGVLGAFPATRPIADEARAAQDAVGGMVLERGYPTTAAGLAGRRASQEVYEPLAKNVLLGGVGAQESGGNPYWSPTSTMRPARATETMPQEGTPANPYTGEPSLPGVMPDRSEAVGIHVISLNGDQADVDVITGRVPPDIGQPVRVTEAMVDALIAGGAGINRDTAVQHLVGNVAVLPDAWRTMLEGAGLLGGNVDVASVDVPAATTAAATDSGSGGGGYTNTYRSSGGGYRRSYGGGGGSYGGGGWGGSSYGEGFPEGFGTGGGMFPGEGMEGFGSDGDAFAEMMANPMFSRYLEVLSRSMGPERARLFMRRFGSRFKGMERGLRSTGKRSKTSRSKGRPSLSVESADAERTSAAPDNAAIQESVRKTTSKATKPKKAKEE